MTNPKSLEQILNGLPKKELIDIILDITNKDASFEKLLLTLYSKDNDSDKEELKKFKTLIQSIVRRYKGRDGFIFYRDSFSFARELEELLEKAGRTQQGMLGLDISLLVLKEAIKAIQYTDDSAGTISDLIRSSLRQIDKKVQERDKADKSMNEMMFKKLLTTSDDRIFNDWEEHRISLLQICVAFADNETRRARLQTKLDQLLQESSDDSSGHISNYYMEDLHRIIYILIEKYGGEEERQRYMADHLHFTYFRAKAIDQSMVSGNFEKVLELALEGEYKDRGSERLVDRWKQARYLAYKELSLKEEQAELAKDMFFNGHFEYYFELQALSSESKEVFYSNLKNELKTKIKTERDWQLPNLLLKLINEEEDLPELLQFVKAKLTYLEEYADRLFKSYPDEVASMYKEYIKKETEQTTNRKEYRKVRKLLQHFKSIAGKSPCEELIEELKALYPRRPAFLDELSKVR